MIKLELFLVGLMIVSAFTSLVTEAIKKILDACKAKYDSVILVGIVAAVLSAAVGVGYAIVMNLGFGATVIVYIVIMTILGWLGAMVGYDNVIKVIKNLKKGDSNEQQSTSDVHEDKSEQDNSKESQN